VPLSRLFNVLAPIHRAQSLEDIEAIRRYRYKICVLEQLSAMHPEADHETRTVGGPTDFEENTCLFYAGTAGRILGTVRARVWKPGEFPNQQAQRYSCDLLPDVSGLSVGEGSYFLADQTKRGSNALVALAAKILETVVEEHRLDVMFMSCIPGLVRAYGRLGMRPFGARIIPSDTGFLVPLLGVSNNLDYLRHVQSPLYPHFKQLKKRGALSQADLSGFVEAVEGYHGLEVDPQAVEQEIEDSLAGDVASPFTAALPESVRAAISRASLIVQLEPGTEVVREDSLDEDIYLVLDGALEVRRGGFYVATLTRGDLFGEMALFRPGRGRSASVVVSARCRAMVIRRSELEKLEENAPRDVLAIYKALAGVMADRLSGI